jgi:hypothetical protein
MMDSRTAQTCLRFPWNRTGLRGGIHEGLMTIATDDSPLLSQFATEEHQLAIELFRKRELVWVKK